MTRKSLYKGKRLKASSSSDNNNSSNDDDVEDKEIKRLERLLSIDSFRNKKSIAEKLNKEFEEFEGIGGNFGTFLLELDGLTNSIRKDSKSKAETLSHNESDEKIKTLTEESSNNIEKRNESVYRPVPGEDIYGNFIGGSKTIENSSKYIPPAKRLAALSEVSFVFQVIIPTIVIIYNFISIIFHFLHLDVRRSHNTTSSNEWSTKSIIRPI
jgi:hypothetical protein